MSYADMIADYETPEVIDAIQSIQGHTKTLLDENGDRTRKILAVSPELTPEYFDIPAYAREEAKVILGIKS